MTEPVSKVASELAYREAVPDDPADATPLLCVHGWPQSSYMWRFLLPEVAAAGRRAIAPDLAGFGDSPPDPPGTFVRHVEEIERFRRELELDRVVLAVHDTGGLIGLRWACDHPDAVAGLVVTNTGFFPNHEWSEIARTMRTPIQGEAVMDSLSRDAFGTLLKETSGAFDEPALDQYWKGLEDAERRRQMLELYRSFEDDELKPYEGRLAALDVPTLILWGETDEFVPTSYAARFAEQIPRSELVRFEDVGHFLFEEDPARCNREVVEFLRRAGV